MKNIETRRKLFIRNAKNIHGNRYIYSKVNYINAITKVVVICRIHGEFNIRPNDHTSGKQNCPRCSQISRERKHRFSQLDFIKRANFIHGIGEYDYSDDVYKTMKIKITIGCKFHGKFQQSPEKHLIGRGCPMCGKLKGGQQINEILKYIDHYNKYNGILYFIKMYDNTEKFYKVGVTSSSIESRFFRQNNIYNIKVIKEVKLKLGDAYIEEDK